MKFRVKAGQGGYSYLELREISTPAEEFRFDSAWLYDRFMANEDSEIRPLGRFMDKAAPKLK